MSARKELAIVVYIYACIYGSRRDRCIYTSMEESDRRMKMMNQEASREKWLEREEEEEDSPWEWSYARGINTYCREMRRGEMMRTSLSLWSRASLELEACGQERWNSSLETRGERKQTKKRMLHNKSINYSLYDLARQLSLWLTCTHTFNQTLLFRCDPWFPY
jgi:hypothetical protein